MADRRQQILVLLETRYDHLPEPVRRTHTASGFAHGVDAHVSCPDCFGEQPARTGCEGCGGRGYLVERRRRDPYAVDRVSPFGLDGVRHERRRELDAEIARLDAQTRPPWPSELDAIADADAHPFSWEVARRRMYAEFSYRELDLALEHLHDHSPGVAARSPRGLAFIDARMPAPIRAPAVVEPPPAKGRALNGHTLKQRDELIRRQVLSEGRPVQLVAREHGVTPARVNQICKSGLPTSDRAAKVRDGASPVTG